jgi:hypothetical protein
MEDVTKGESSKFREAGNLVIRLKRMVASGELEKGAEVLVFTDNAVAESTYFKGSSKNSKLHQLILGLRKMEMEGELIIHFVWIAGKRMIAQGTDGLSRGEPSSGVMAGEDFLKFLPLNETAFEQAPKLESQVRGWLGSKEWKVTSTADWFHEVFQDPEGAWIWAPPPVLAKVVVEQMCEAKHIFPNSKHVFVCPAIMTGYCGKLSDTMFTITARNRGVWSKQMYEPLKIAFVCPLLSSRPWNAGRLNRMSKWERDMHEVQGKDSRAIRNHMRKFWVSPNGERECRNAWHGACFKQDKGDTFPVLQVRDLDDSLVDESTLEDDDPNRFKEAREGDYLMTPFKCP